MSLSNDEIKALELTRDLVNLVCSKIIGYGPTRDEDCNAFVDKIHDIQYMIMAQSAARSHPDLLRLLGEMIKK